MVEDNSNDRLLLQEAFDEIGRDVLLQFVGDGEAAIDYLHCRNQFARKGAAPHPALVLMDLNMPRMNGNEMVRAIRADPRLHALPVIVFSTTDDPRQISRSYVNGVNAFMTKPGRFEDFVEVLRNFAAFWFDSARLPAAPADLG